MNKAKYTEDKGNIWERRYSLAADNQTKMMKKWADWYKTMYAVLNEDNIAPWRSKILIPLLSTKAWNMIAKFIDQEPGFEVTVRDETDRPDDEEQSELKDLEKIAEKVQKKLEYDYHNPDLDEPMREKLNTVLIDAVVTGTGLAKVPWVVKNKQEKSHPTNEYDEVDFEQDVVTSMPVGFNDLEPVNIFNVFVAPAAKSFQSSPWVIIREFKSLEDLKATNNKYGVEVYKNLDNIEGASTSDRFAQYTKSRENLTTEQDAISADQTVKMIEIFECYEKGKICTYAAVSKGKGKTGSQWVTIREQSNPYWHGKYPLVPFYVRRRPFSVWGEGIFETTERLQAGANDVFNHYMDNWNLSIDGMMMQDEQSVIDDFIVEPGGTLVYKDTKPDQFRFPEPNPNQLTLVMDDLQQFLEQATISNYATGTPQSGLDKTQGTARGTASILEAASDMIQYMRNNFIVSVKTFGQMWLSNNRQFMNFDFEVPVLKANQAEAEFLTPQELQLQMELRINDMDMQPISKQQRKDNVLAYQQNAIQLQTASIAQAQITGDKTQILTLDYHSFLVDSAKEYGVKSALKQIVPPEEAFAVQNEEEEGMALEEEFNEVADEEAIADEQASLMMEDATIPDDAELDKAEQTLAQLNG